MDVWRGASTSYMYLRKRTRNKMIESRKLANFVDDSCFELKNKVVQCRSYNLLDAVYPYIEKVYGNYPVMEIINLLKEAAQMGGKRKYGMSPTEDSLNNCGGRWYEILFLDQAVSALNKIYERYNRKFQIFKLPSAQGSMVFHNIFKNPFREEISQLGLQTSNPDFIITEVNRLRNYYETTDWESSRGKARIKNLLTLFRERGYYGQLGIDEIKVILSVKTSTRPDRRYQHMHEANILKAIFRRFNRECSYVVIATEVKEKDREIFLSPSIMSIVDPSSLVKPTIDKIVEIDQFKDIAQIEQILI
jgi:hypothetical protein